MNKFLFFLLFLPTVVFAGHGKGEKLLNRLWEDLAAGKIKKVEHYTSKEFQALVFGNVINRRDFLNFFRLIHIDSYKIENLKITQGEKVIVATYQGTVTASCNNGIKKVSFVAKTSDPTWKMDVFKKFGKKWKWVARGEPAPFDV